MKHWLIAHRGARCDARENTLAAFEATKKYPLGYCELDIHTTKDNVVICHHDFDIEGRDIGTSTYKQLKKLDPELTTFDEAIKAIDSKLPLVVHIKAAGTAKNVVEIIRSHPNWRAASFNIDELKYLIDAGIDGKRIYVFQRHEPLTHIGRAVKAGIGGVALHHGYLSPIWYWRAKRQNLKMYVYSVNSLWEARLIRIFYPKLGICTDRPDLIQKLD